MGIGYACAQAYAREGAKVAIAALHEKPSLEAAAALGSGHLGFHCDVTLEDDVKRGVERTLAAFGKLDAIHNNAGTAAPSKALHETSNEEWRKVVDTNVQPLLFTARYGFDALKATRGSILNTSSLVGRIGQENHAAYAGTKGAVDALTRSMALDYAPYGIRVNAVCPAGVWTPMLREWARQQSDAESIQQYLDDIHPLGPCPEGDVIADACVFLLSDMSRFMTGHCMPVGGGAELGYRR